MKVPASTLANISPPDRTGYDFFRLWDTHPLIETSEFNLVNAWRLSEVALLTYDTQANISGRLKAMTGHEGQLFKSSETEYLLIKGQSGAIVSFRGTEIDNLGGAGSDWFTDFRIRLKDQDGGFRIHEGFKAALDRVWDNLIRDIESVSAKGTALWITGHSLGAALATLAAHRISTRNKSVRVNAVYTYGSPKVGDSRFRDDLISAGLGEKLFRIRNNADLITRVPPFSGYCHVGKSQFIDNSGHLHRDCEPPQEEGLATVAATIAEVIHLLPSLDPVEGRNRIINGAIADHSPTAYTIHLLNNLGFV